MKNVKEDTSLITTKELFTRFGKVNINLDREITFAQGIIGLAHLQRYVLIDFPQQFKFDNFKILQSIEDPSISFIVLPISKDTNNLFGGMIHESDILTACDFLKIQYEDLAITLILNLKKSSDKDFSAFLNLRAPIFIDAASLKGFQYILPNNSYEVSKKL